MAAREYQLEIDAIDATLVSIEKVLDLPKLRKQAAELEVEAGVPNLWDDPEAAQKITSRLSRVQSEIAKLSGLRQRVEDLLSLHASRMTASTEISQGGGAGGAAAAALLSRIPLRAPMPSAARATTVAGG